VHTSNLFVTEPAVALAEALARLTGWDDARVFFAQCGATANEAAIKLARRHGKRRIPTRSGWSRSRAPSTGGRWPRSRRPASRPSTRRSRRSPASSITSPTTTPRRCVAAVGPRPRGAARGRAGRGRGASLHPRRARAAREACDEHGALLMIDEVQTGIGRTGPWFAFQDTDRRARRDHGGQGAGQRSADRRVHRAGRRRPRCSNPGDHATTFGGNPVTCAAHWRSSTRSRPKACSRPPPARRAARAGPDARGRRAPAGRRAAWPGPAARTRAGRAVAARESRPPAGTGT
jgi:acetylornithine/N-succinyldiaminopimelate aminotransferase